MSELICETCKREIDESTAVWFELSFKTGKWYKPGECPADESQGGFAFGPDCAKKISVVEFNEDGKKLVDEYGIPTFKLDVARSAIKKINRRAAKLGVTPITFEVIGEETRKIQVGHNPIDDKPTYVEVPYTLVRVTGEAPTVAGWTFAATIQHEEAGNILRKTPGMEEIEVPHEYREAKPWCDHCRTTRRRIDTFLVTDGQSWKQVGRNCLCDFLGGHDPHRAVAMLQAWRDACSLGGDLDEEEFWGCGGWSSEWVRFGFDNFLTAVAYCTRRDGWLSRTAARERNFDGCATADEAWSLLTPSKDRTVEERRRRELDKIEDGDRRTAEGALEWAQTAIIGKDVAKRNDYEHNLAVALQHSEGVSFKEAGLVGSLIVVYQKAMEREIQRRKARENKKNEHFGELEAEKTITRGKNKGKVKKYKPRYELELLVVRVYVHDPEPDYDNPNSAYYGPTYIHTMEDEEGRCFVWYGSNVLRDEEYKEIQQGDTFKATWSIKKHAERDGVKQTVVTRPSGAVRKKEEAAA